MDASMTRRTFVKICCISSHEEAKAPAAVGAAEPVAREIAREIEATYPGYQQIPPELGNEVVPDVATSVVLMADATIYACLFLKVWIWVDPG
jgi:hypothetical protein